MERHILSRTLHDVGLAAWFGGSLMGAVGLNGAAASLRDPEERAAAATVGWNRWVPVNALGIGAHLIGAVRLLQTEKGRVARQRGVGRSSAVKTAVTAAALGTTAYSGILNRKMAAAGRVPVLGATEPSPNTPPDVAATQKQLKAIQWAIPSITGALISITAWQSEQMRPKQVLLGHVPGLSSLSGRAPAIGALAGGVLLVSRLRKRSSAKKSLSSSYSAPYDTSSGRTSPSGMGTTGTTTGTATSSSAPTRSLADPDGPGTSTVGAGAGTGTLGTSSSTGTSGISSTGTASSTGTGTSGTSSTGTGNVDLTDDSRRTGDIRSSRP